MTTLRDQAVEIIENMGQALAKSRKAEIPEVFETHTQYLLDYIDTLLGGNAVKITSTASTTKNKKMVELQDETTIAGVATPNQVKVGVTMGLTRNLGNFNSARFDAHVETFTNDTEEDVVEGLKRANVLVEAEIVRRQEELGPLLRKES